MQIAPKSKKIFIVAGEASGDNIGAKLIKELKKIDPTLTFKGVGGIKMQAQGLVSIFPIQELSIMGFMEIIPCIPRILRRLNNCFQTILQFNPDILITIDSYGFNSRLVKRVRKAMGSKIKIIHYVAPTVWAYKPERANVIAQLYDHQLLTLPFEKSYFDSVGATSTFVQNPIVEDAAPTGDLDQKKIRKKYNIPHYAKIVIVMPGSRIGEIKRHADIFAKALSNIQKEKNIFIYIPTFLHLEKLVKKYFADNCLISNSEITKKELFSIADVALVKSGTSSLEMVLYSIPCIVAYKINHISYLYLKAKVKVKYISLVNIIAEEEVIPEYIQNNCTVDKITSALNDLLTNPKKQKYQKQKFTEVLEALGYHSKPTPSQKAARIILGYLNKSTHLENKQILRESTYKENVTQRKKK